MRLCDGGENLFYCYIVSFELSTWLLVERISIQLSKEGNRNKYFYTILFLVRAIYMKTGAAVSMPLFSIQDPKIASPLSVRFLHAMDINKNLFSYRHFPVRSERGRKRQRVSKCGRRRKRSIYSESQPGSCLHKYLSRHRHTYRQRWNK